MKRIIITLSDSFISPALANTSLTYSGKPSSFSALSMCSVAIVFFASRSAMSLASEEMSVMNSTQQSMRRSRASRAKVMVDSEGGEEAVVERISVIIFWTVAMRRGEERVLVRYPEEGKMGAAATGEGDEGMLELRGCAHLLVRRDRRCLCTCQPLRGCVWDVELTSEFSVRHTGRGLRSVWNERTHQLLATLLQYPRIHKADLVAITADDSR